MTQGTNQLPTEAVQRETYDNTEQGGGQRWRTRGTET